MYHGTEVLHPFNGHQSLIVGTHQGHLLGVQLEQRVPRHAGAYMQRTTNPRIDVTRTTYRWIEARQEECPSKAKWGEAVQRRMPRE